MDEAARLVGGAIGGLFGLALVFCFVTVIIGWPLMALSAVRNISKIRKQLERLNDVLESRGAGDRGGVLGI